MKMASLARATIFIAIPSLMICGAASAEETYSAGQMWGTQPAGIAVNGALESSVAHYNQGVIAGQVKAARKGLLVATGAGGSITVQSIGSQSVINQIINGENITAAVNAEQSAVNTADVINNGGVKF